MDAVNSELIITRNFNAPRRLVWQAWIDPEQALHWWGPTHHPAVSIELDVRVGGRWRHCLKSQQDGGLLWHGGVFREVVEPEKLVFSFAWEEPGERGLETLVTVTFFDAGDTTQMTLRQAPFVSSGEQQGHTEGWNSTFDRLLGWLQLAGK